MAGPRVTGESPGVPVVTILRIVRSAQLGRKNLPPAENSQIVVRSGGTIGLNSQGPATQQISCPPGNSEARRVDHRCPGSGQECVMARLVSSIGRPGTMRHNLYDFSYNLSNLGLSV